MILGFYLRSKFKGIAGYPVCNCYKQQISNYSFIVVVFKHLLWAGLFTRPGKITRTLFYPEKPQTAREQQLQYSEERLRRQSV